MVAGIVLSSRNIRLTVPKTLVVLAQGVLGCLMARSLQPSTLIKVANDWPIFLGGAVSVIAASAGLGWVLMRRQVLPGTTVVWGLAPGAASAMVVMADAYGADARLVAFMQYSRVVLVTVVASMVAWLWSPHPTPATVNIAWFSIVNAGDIGWTLLLAFTGSLFARWLSIPAGPLLLPLLVGAALQALGLLVIELPSALLAITYTVLGWSFGLRFTQAILRHAFRALPQVLAAIFVLIGVGIFIAAILTLWFGLDPLTAYLATSPGGADSVAIIAANSAVDVGFVMAMQLARFLMVLAFGPSVSKFIASRKSVVSH
jgi:membrane AbrB-like protein